MRRFAALLVVAAFLAVALLPAFAATQPKAASKAGWKAASSDTKAKIAKPVFSKKTYRKHHHHKKHYNKHRPSHGYAGPQGKAYGYHGQVPRGKAYGYHGQTPQGKAYGYHGQTPRGKAYGYYGQTPRGKAEGYHGKKRASSIRNPRDSNSRERFTAVIALDRGDSSMKKSGKPRHE